MNAAIVILALPDQKTSRDNCASWKPGLTPGTGLLTIHTESGSVSYPTTEFPTPWHGRAFHLAKSDDSYDVFVGSNGQDFIHTESGSVSYPTTEFPTPWHGRAFHLAKSDDSYDVFVGSNGQDFQCSCKGFAYGRGRPCKHVLACRALIESELVNSEADVSNTELPDQPEPQPARKPFPFEAEWI